jgi:hypothetical protein
VKDRKTHLFNQNSIDSSKRVILYHIQFVGSNPALQITHGLPLDLARGGEQFGPELTAEGLVEPEARVTVSPALQLKNK